MVTDNFFGKNSYFFDHETDPGEIARLLSYGVQQVDQGVILYNEKRKIIFANKHAFTMFYVLDDLKELDETFKHWMDRLGVEYSTTTWCRVYSVGEKERLYRVRYRHLIDEEGKPMGHMYIIQNMSDIVDNGTGEQYRSTDPAGKQHG